MDSSGFAATATVSGSFIINTGVTGSQLVFGQSGNGTAGDAAGLVIAGDLEGAANGRGGDLSISTFDEATAGGSGFQVDGSTMLGQLTIAAGSGLTNAGQNVFAVFGNGNDAFDVTGLTINAGNADGVNAGGNATVTIASDSGAEVVTVGATGISINGGDALTGQVVNGGVASLVVSDSASIAGAVGVTGGDEGSDTGNGGNASIDFNDAAGTVMLAEALTISTGSADAVAGSQAGSAEAIFASSTVNANGGLVLSEDEESTATAILTLDGTGDQTFNGAITATNDGDGEIEVNNTGGATSIVNFASNIGADGSRVGAVTLTNAGIVDFDGNLVVGTITTFADTVEARFDGDVDAIEISSADTISLDFNGGLTIGGGNLTLGNGDATFAGNVSGTGTVIVDTGDDATFDGTTTQTVDVAIRSIGLEVGNVTIENTSDGGVVFNSTVGAPGNGVGTIDLVADANATFNDTVFGAGLTLGDGVTITINDTGASPMVNLSANEGLSLATSTINLGSAVGDQDIVFRLEDAGTNVVFAQVDDETTVNLAANFLEGDLTLIDDNGDLTTVADQITVTQTALTTFTEDTTTTVGDLIITATARSASDTADLLGISQEDAEALRQAVISTDATDDDEGLDALTAALNAGGTQAQQAAQQVGPQGTTLGGGAQTAFGLMGEQQSATGNRLAGFRSGDPRFVSAFAATETGFSGGDLDGPYAPLAPRYTNSVWFQAFGGVADADGDATGAGYDAGFGGAMIGIDGALTDDVTIGAFGSYSFSSVDGDGAGNAQLDANTYAIGVYGSYTGASFYLDAFASYAGSDNDVSRTAFAQTITASYDASQFAVGLAGGVPIEVSSNVFITPNASLTYNHYDADSYTETGSAGFSARVNPGSASQLTGTLGARMHAVYEYASGTSFIPELRVGIIGDLIDDDAVSTASFVGGGTAFNVTGTDTDDIGVLIGLGLAMENDAWSAGISYDADIRGDYMSQTGRAEFRWKF